VICIDRKVRGNLVQSQSVAQGARGQTARWRSAFREHGLRTQDANCEITLRIGAHTSVELHGATDITGEVCR